MPTAASQFLTICAETRQGDGQRGTRDGDPDSIIWRSVAHRFFHPVFRPLIVAPLILAAAGFALVKPWWSASPEPGFPPLKLSSLDLLQARADSRRAAREAAACDWPAAAEAWRSALQKNPFDVKAHRGLLSALLHATNAPSMQNELAPLMGRLLNLTRTNRQDLVLVTRVLLKCGRYADVCALLARRENDLGAELEGIYAQALFEAGELDEFDSRLSRAGAALTHDAVITLYAAARQAVSGPALAAAGAQQGLEEATRGPYPRLADHLLLVVAERKSDVTLGQAALQRLQQMDADTLGDNALFWRLLAAEGRQREAIQLAQACCVHPVGTDETRETVRVLKSLGLKQAALDLLRRARAPGDHDAMLDLYHARLLIQDQNCGELRDLARDIAARAGTHRTLRTLSWFCEAMARWSLRKPWLWPERADLLVSPEVDDPSLAIGLVALVVELSLYEDAAVLLSTWKTSLRDDPRYWSLSAAVAMGQHNEIALTHAAQQIHERAPKSLAAACGSTAALLAARNQADQALRFTSEALVRWPADPTLRLLHGAALAFNGKGPEAIQVLDRLNAAELPASQASQYQLALFEACLQVGEQDRANQHRQRIDLKQLYPAQVRWLKGVDLDGRYGRLTDAGVE